ncbi:MAG: hypothetical protein CL868_09990 [Cytophagaceae bacterium]|nr:hypothetical protein [Cytophagaceae bacterium]
MQVLIRPASMRKGIIILTVLYTIVLTVACLGPAPQSFEQENSPDKFYHITATFLLFMAWFTYGYMIALRQKPFPRVLIIISLLTFCYGMIIEVLQGTFTTYRTADGYDLLANSVGILIGIVVVCIFRNQINSIKAKF